MGPEARPDRPARAAASRATGGCGAYRGRVEGVLVVANPCSGNGRAAALADAVADEARRAGHDAEVAVPASEAAVRAAVASAVDRGTGRVVAVGGDGLVHLVLQEVACTPAVLGIVPCGTGNDYALGLGLRPAKDVAAMARTALAPGVAVDALRTNHGWVASVATVGFSADVNERAERMRWPRGSLRYTLATVLELPRLRPAPWHLEVDGEVHELEATLVAFGTTAYFGGAMAICPRAAASGGRAEITVIGACGRLELVRAFPRVFKGTHLSHPAVTALSGREIALTAPGAPARARADGEALGPLPLRATTVAGAVQVAGARPGPVRADA